MRKWLASIAVLGMASAAATAQTVPVPPVGGCGQTQSLLWDDGTFEVGWRLNFNTAVGDSWATDFNDDAAGMTVTGVAIATMQSYSFSAGPIGIRYVKLCPDNLAVSTLGRTPDLNAPLAQRNSTSGAITGANGPSAGYCPGFVGFDTPDLLVPSTGGLHAATTFVTGDSASWLCADATIINPVNNRHSEFTTNSFATAGLSDSWDYGIRLIASLNPAPGSAYLTVNNSIAPVSIGQAAQIQTSLWSSCGPLANQPTTYLQGVFLPTFIPVPSFTMQTGIQINASTGTSVQDPFVGTICAPLSDISQGPCVPAGAVFDVGAFYLDRCTIKKNKKPKLRLTNLVTVTVTANTKVCNPCVCFGQVDDGRVDAFIWKVNYPAQSRDYFNVRVGSFFDPNSGLGCGTTVTDIQVSSFDRCGSGPSWDSVGLYLPNTGLDPSGGTPNLGSPVALATTLSMVPLASDVSYPVTIYDFPDVSTTASTLLNTTLGLHVAAKWKTGDTCVWMGGDSDGVDDDSTSTGVLCSSIPNTTSFFAYDGFVNAALTNPGQNWLEKVDYF